MGCFEVAEHALQPRRFARRGGETPDRAPGPVPRAEIGNEPGAAAERGQIARQAQGPRVIGILPDEAEAEALGRVGRHAGKPAAVTAREDAIAALSRREGRARRHEAEKGRQDKAGLHRGACKRSASRSDNAASSFMSHSHSTTTRHPAAASAAWAAPSRAVLRATLASQ